MTACEVQEVATAPEKDLIYEEKAVSLILLAPYFNHFQCSCHNIFYGNTINIATFVGGRLHF